MYLSGENAETFSLDAYLSRLDPALLAHPEGRRILTRLDPLLFALVYFPHHLKDQSGRITFGDPHLDWCAKGRTWVRKPVEPAEDRDAYVAPRGCGKSTWWYLIMPLWAAAHGHTRFTAAFADSSNQAEMHLQTVKHELETNELLRTDFPLLCSPALRSRGSTMSDHKGMLITKAGFVFAAKGIDSAALGMKVGEVRPDLILLDDIEPDESSYSAYQREKRLTTLRDAILPLNIYARVVLVGTVTMPGSIVHALVNSAMSDPEPWIAEERFRVHHYRPIVARQDGTQRSIWPGKWSLEYLLGIRHTRSFAKNFENDPRGYQGDYWSQEDFRYGDLPTSRTGLFVDPAVTTSSSSDFTGYSVTGYSPVERKCVVRYAQSLRHTPKQMAEHVLRLLQRFPEIKVLYVESNQGGDTWKSVFENLPIQLLLKPHSEKKEIRALDALHHYQTGRVLHAEPFTDAEQEMITFPKAPHDDLVDSVGSGVRFFLGKSEPPKKFGVTTTSYV